MISYAKPYQFDYDLHTPIHTLGILFGGGMGFPVTPARTHLYKSQ